MGWMRRSLGVTIMKRRRPVRTAAAALLAAGLSLGAATVAQAALDPAALAAVERPEVADAAREIAAVLDGVAGDDQQAIVAALHRYLAASAYSSSVLEDALGVVLAGDWTPTQLAALRSLFAEYAPADVRAPRGGPEPMLDAPPPGAADRARLAAVSADTPSGEEGSVSEQGRTLAPPPLTTSGGGSDYQP
jgi:hypothetical protein